MLFYYFSIFELTAVMLVKKIIYLFIDNNSKNHSIFKCVEKLKITESD